VRVESSWMNFVLFIHNRKNCSKSIVSSISFHDELSIRDPMYENESQSKCFLEEVKSISIEGIKLPENVLLGNVC